MLGKDDEVYRQIGAIASQFGVFDCIPCARAIKGFLEEQQISGKHIKLDTGSQDPLYGRIYDDGVGELIATTGHHEGIAIAVDGQELIFDNIHPQGLIRATWIQNLYSPLLDEGSFFQITETEF
jgi:Papain fold toxin 2